MRFVTIPNSRRLDVGRLAATALPLGAGMRSSIDPDVLAVHHRCRLQIEQRIHDLGDPGSSRTACAGWWDVGEFPRSQPMHLVLIALAMLAACVIVQSMGTLVMIQWVARARRVFESPYVVRRVGLLLGVFTFIVLLHLIQIALWAVAFWRAGELPTLETAVYFSITTYTTVGFGDG